MVSVIWLGFSIESAQAIAEIRQENPLDYTIAFSSLAPWDLDAFIANADGSDPKPLASHPDLDYNAAFSPDGQWIIFTSHRDGGADLYGIRPDGSSLKRLTDHLAFDDAAAFGGVAEVLSGLLKALKIQLLANQHQHIWCTTLFN